MTSAISRTTTGGKSWNQISLIDYANTTDNYTVTVIKADATYSKTQTLWIFTGVTKYTDAYGQPAYRYGALWKTTNGGLNYEEIFSFANPTTTRNMHAFTTTADGSIFTYDKYGNAAAGIPGKYWRSSDGGATWPTVINTYAGYVAASAIDANTLWTCAYSTGTCAIWSTTNAGLSWVKPDENIVTGYPIAFSFGSANKIVLVGNSAGTVFISTDAGKTFKKRLGVTDAGAGSAYAAFDPAYATNKFVYCTIGYGAVANGGIWRIVVNEAAPDTTLWQRIDGNEANSGYVKPTVAFDLLGVFYCWDGATVGDGAGGMWRSVNPRDDPLGLYPPKFETVIRGLPTGTKIAFAGYAVSPNTIFAFLKSDTTKPVPVTVAYYNQLIAMADTLSSPVTLISPADKATGIGSSATTESLYMNVTLSWTAMTGALYYHLQVATDAAFVSKVAEYSTSATTQEIIGTFLPGNVYYWRVRVGNYAAGVTAGAPLISPWATVRSFTVGVPFALALKIISPATGAMDVPVLPTFVWTVLPGVTTYELVVSEDPTFAIIDWSRTSDKAYFQADESLAYSTTYYWRVRQTGGTWVNGIFTTQAEPTTPPPPFTFTQPPETTITVVPGPTTEAVPGYLLWIIIAIGAVLVIALIVLIIRTRRSA